MKRTLVLAGFLVMLVAPCTVHAHGRSGHSAPPSGYRPLPTGNSQPLTFPNQQQPKFVTPSSIMPVKPGHPLGSKLVNPTLYPVTGSPISAAKVGGANFYALKGAKVLSGKYYKHHGGYPYWCWFGPCYCDFCYPGFFWTLDVPIVIVPQTAPGGEELLPPPMPVQPVAQATPADPPPAPAAAVQFERFLQVKNDTKEKVRFFVLFHSKGADGKAAWVPAEPGAPATVYSVEVEPGKSLDLTDDDNRPISADRVRIWAASPSRQWLDHEKTDLWLVPEADSAGNHRYEAPQMQTHTFALTD